MSKGGRPRKPEGEKAEHFSLRLAPKLRFGLEAVARLQGRSMSQVIEWGLKTSLQSIEVGRAKGSSLWEVINYAWSEPNEWQRTRMLYSFDQALVSFEARHACRLLDKSREETLWNFTELTDEVRERMEKIGGLRLKWKALIELLWPLLIKDAEELKLEPILERHTLIVASGLYLSLHGNYPPPDETTEQTIEKSYFRAQEIFKT